MRLNKSPLCCGNSIITGNPCRNYAGTGDFCRYHQEQISGKNKYGVPITQKYASQNNFCYNHKSTPSDNQNVIHQCEGITVIGERCKNKYKYRGKYCHIHNESIEEIENNKFKEKDFLNESLKVEITDDLILGSTPLDMTHQCERITKLGNRCKNKFKYQGKFCHQHNKFAEKLNNALFVPGFGKRKYYSIDEWINPNISQETKTLLKNEMEKPISESDESGFIYAYRYRLPETENHSQYTLYKVGRTINVLKRLYQWDKQCKYNPELIETFPMIVLSTFNKQIINCKYVHRAERLIHIELKARFKADTEKCKNCGRMHQEWFKVTNLDSSNIINGMHGWDEIHKIIVHWISYIEKVYG